MKVKRIKMPIFMTTSSQVRDEHTLSPYCMYISNRPACVTTIIKYIKIFDPSPTTTLSGERRDSG